MSCFRFSVIPILADILSDSVKEKVTRIILAVFRVSVYDLLKDVIKVNTTHFHIINHVMCIMYCRQYSMVLPLPLIYRPNCTNLCECNMSCHMCFCYQWTQSSSSSLLLSIDSSNRMCCPHSFLTHSLSFPNLSACYLVSPTVVYLIYSFLCSLRNPIVIHNTCLFFVLVSDFTPCLFLNDP